MTRGLLILYFVWFLDGWFAVLGLELEPGETVDGMEQGMELEFVAQFTGSPRDSRIQARGRVGALFNGLFTAHPHQYCRTSSDGPPHGFSTTGRDGCDVRGPKDATKKCNASFRSHAPANKNYRRRGDEITIGTTIMDS